MWCINTNIGHLSSRIGVICISYFRFALFWFISYQIDQKLFMFLTYFKLIITWATLKTIVQRNINSSVGKRKRFPTPSVKGNYIFTLANDIIW